jgi:hypothetical protein
MIWATDIDHLLRDMNKRKNIHFSSHELEPCLLLNLGTRMYCLPATPSRVQSVDVRVHLIKSIHKSAVNYSNVTLLEHHMHVIAQPFHCYRS